MRRQVWLEKSILPPIRPYKRRNIILTKKSRWYRYFCTYMRIRVHNKACHKPYCKYNKSNIAQRNWDYSFVKNFFSKFDLFNNIIYFTERHTLINRCRSIMSSGVSFYIKIPFRFRLDLRSIRIKQQSLLSQLLPLLLPFL